MIKCRRFFTTTEYDYIHGNYTCNATQHFNDWSRDDIKIVSVQALGDSNGCCKEVVVFYEEVQKDEAR